MVSLGKRRGLGRLKGCFRWISLLKQPEKAFSIYKKGFQSTLTWSLSVMICHQLPCSHHTYVDILIMLWFVISYLRVHCIAISFSRVQPSVNIQETWHVVTARSDMCCLTLLHLVVSWCDLMPMSPFVVSGCFRRTRPPLSADCAKDHQHLLRQKN